MLVRLPKEVRNIMVSLRDAGYEVFITGECIRESMLGRNPYGWDLVTDAGIEFMKGTFPEARVLSEKYEVLRFEYIEEVMGKDGELEETGLIIDLGRYKKLIRADGGEDGVGDERPIICELAEEGFTMDAIAENQNEIVDPFGGRDDIKKKLIRTVGDADEAFRKQPVLMLKVARLASQCGFDVDKPVYEAILRNRDLLETVDADKIREEFTMLISADNTAGKGLEILLETGMVAAVIGRDVVDRLSKREVNDLLLLSRNIDRSKPVEARRLGLFFSCIDKRKIRPAIERLRFDEKTEQHLIDAVTDMAKLYFSRTKPALKKFIYERGMDRYEYLLNLEKAQRIVFDYHIDTKIKSKMYMLDEILRYREPIFPEDLKIDAEDLIEAGICTEANAEKILKMMAEALHVYPEKNNRDELMKLAALYSRNKLAAAMRGIRWIK